MADASRHNGARPVKGRPTRHPNEAAGRERLIEAARSLLRRKPHIALPRRELALAAGVTPGLVTYYFPDELSLVEAVAKPIIEHYLTRLKVLLAAEHRVETTFRSLVLLFLEISQDNGALLDAYINFVKQTDAKASSNFLAGAYVELGRFLSRCVEETYLKPANEAFRQTVIWGTCKMVAQSPELTAMLLSTMKPDEDLAAYQADLIIDVLIAGFGSKAVVAREDASRHELSCPGWHDDGNRDDVGSRNSGGVDRS